MIYFALQWVNVFQRKRLLSDIQKRVFPSEYERILTKFRPYQFLTPPERKKFQTKVLYFIEDKRFNGVGDLIVTDEMKVLVAAEACLMITNIEGDIYPGLKNIYIVEDVFIPKDNPVNAFTGLPFHTARLGEAWKRGPIVLSWRSIVNGSSVIYHEFSHHLDQQDGSFDGTPDLGRNGNYDKWAQVMTKDFLKLRELISLHKKADIDSYGATNEAEFFAVITEAFFTRPTVLKIKHPELYDILQEYFKLNPASWGKRENNYESSQQSYS